MIKKINKKYSLWSDKWFQVRKGDWPAPGNPGMFLSRHCVICTRDSPFCSSKYTPSKMASGGISLVFTIEAAYAEIGKQMGFKQRKIALRCFTWNERLPDGGTCGLSRTRFSGNTHFPGWRALWPGQNLLNWGNIKASVSLLKHTQNQIKSHTRL